MTTVGPNRNTIGLCAVLGAMWYAGAGQSNGAAYLLCFTLLALAMVSVVHAWANLRGITVSAGPIRSVFAGEELAVPVRVEAQPGRRHVALWIEADGDSRPTGAGNRAGTLGEATCGCARRAVGASTDRIAGEELLSARLSHRRSQGEIRQTYFLHPSRRAICSCRSRRTRRREAQSAPDRGRRFCRGPRLAAG